MRAAAIFALMLVIGVIYFMTTWDDEEEEEMNLNFSDRLKLEALFYKLARGQTPMVKENPNSVIAFLEGNNLIDEDKAKKFILENLDE